MIFHRFWEPPGHHFGALGLASGAPGGTAAWGLLLWGPDKTSHGDLDLAKTLGKTPIGQNGENQGP